MSLSYILFYSILVGIGKEVTEIQEVKGQHSSCAFLAFLSDVFSKIVHGTSCVVKNLFRSSNSLNKARWMGSKVDCRVPHHFMYFTTIDITHL